MTPLEPKKFSERLGVIEPEQLHAVAELFDLGTVREAEPAPGGLFGQNLFLTTSRDRYVLRGNPHGHVQLTKERRAARFITERSTLPAPWPYEICEDDSIFGWTFAVMPRLDGCSGEQLLSEASDEAKIAIAEACGDALADMHEGAADFFGPYDGQTDDFVAMDDFPAWWLHRFEHWRSLCRAVNALSTGTERYIDDLLEKYEQALTVTFTPTIVHHDFKPGNLNLDASTFDPTGVFDLGEAYLADGEEDLVRMLWTLKADEERRAFLSAYTDAYPLREAATERLTLYALCDWLVIWEYGKRNGIWFEDVGFIDSFEPIKKTVERMTT